MHSPAFLDQLIANAWPAAHSESFGGWTYRWTSGITRRANSALALGDGDDLIEKITYGERFYSRYAASPTILVSSASAPSALAPLLEARGHSPTVRTLVMRASADEVVASLARAPWTVSVSNEVTDTWFETYWGVEAAGRFGNDARPIFREVLLVPDRPSIYASASRDGACAGVGQVVLDRGWAGVQCVATHAGFRRQGAASAVLLRLADEALHSGCADVYLAVMADNLTALRLYERLGFVISHEYCYYALSH